VTILIIFQVSYSNVSLCDRMQLHIVTWIAASIIGYFCHVIHTHFFNFIFITYFYSCISRSYMSVSFPPQSRSNYLLSCWQHLQQLQHLGNRARDQYIQNNVASRRGICCHIWKHLVTSHSLQAPVSIATAADQSTAYLTSVICTYMMPRAHFGKKEKCSLQMFLNIKAGICRVLCDISNFVKVEIFYTWRFQG
jgi:hypothetical protein